MKDALIRRARQISVQDRMTHLMSFTEKDMHSALAKLFSEIDKDATVTITHSPGEVGADLVVIRSDEIRESVASVVVTMGHMRGETGGRIDRISSQIKQCLDMPREISTRVDSARTTEVWLVIVGEITGGAKKRLRYQVRKDYKPVLTILDIEWLVKKFTNHYPEIFLGGETLDFIEERINQLEITASLSKKAANLNLSEWYVDPYLSTGGIPIEIDDSGQKLTIRNQRFQFRTLRAVIEKEKKLIISGEPGVGKTTALSKLVLDMLRELSNQVVGGRQTGPIALPVIIPANDLLDCENCNSLIAKCIAKGQLKPGFLIGTLIIDGLDEVLDEYRKGVMEKASTFCSEMNWNLIIGTRKIEIIKNPPKEIKTFELMPFEVSQAIKLFERIVKEGKLLNALKEGLAKVITQLPMTPMSLTILIEIAEEYGEVPASLADLYNRYFEMVLGKWDFRDKGVGSLFQYETKLHFMAEIAWKKFMHENNIEITKDEFGSFIKEYIDNFGFDTAWINRFITEIERAGLIEIKDMVSFKHRSFLDYFAALYLFNHQDELDDTDQLVANLYFSDLWADVAFYFIGIRRAISTRTLERILNFPGDNFGTRIGKYTIGRLLQAGWLSTTSVKYDGINSALSNLLPIRDQLAESFEHITYSPGLIFADFLPVVAAEWTMGSITLVTSVMRTATELAEDKSKESLWKRLATMWALWRFLPDKEREEMISFLLSDISDSQVLTTQDKSILLLLMVPIRDKSKSIRSSINKRLRRLSKRNPAIFKKLLPPVREGFRKKTPKPI